MVLPGPTGRLAPSVQLDRAVEVVLARCGGAGLDHGPGVVGEHRRDGLGDDEVVRLLTLVHDDEVEGLGLDLGARIGGHHHEGRAGLLEPDALGDPDRAGRDVVNLRVAHDLHGPLGGQAGDGASEEGLGLTLGGGEQSDPEAVLELAQQVRVDDRQPGQQDHEGGAGVGDDLGLATLTGGEGGDLLTIPDDHRLHDSSGEGHLIGVEGVADKDLHELEHLVDKAADELLRQFVEGLVLFEEGLFDLGVVCEWLELGVHG